MKRLLFVDNDSRTFVSHRLDLAAAAAHNGFDVHVATPAGPGVPAIVNGGFQHHTYHLRRARVDPCATARTVCDLARLYRNLQPHLIHHLRLKPIVAGAVAARYECHAAIVNAVTGLGYTFHSPRVHARIIRSIVSPALRAALRYKRQIAIFQNPDDRDYCVRAGMVDPHRSVVILGSGVDTNVFQPKPEPPGLPLVVLASRMLWDKGVKMFVEAATALAHSGFHARFALVGGTDPGNPSGISENQLLNWTKTTPVEWWGERLDMDAIMCQSAVICLPSCGEGVPRVLLEAAASGRPIVATDVPGCREIVHDRENGFLIRPDDTAALAASIARMISEPELRQKMGEAGAAMVRDRFSLQHVISATLSVYGEALHYCRRSS